MSLILPQDYIVEKFYSYVGYPKFKPSSNVYYGGCPICREGKSWGKKARCFYIPNKNVVCCHNCQRTWSPVNWIMEISDLSYRDILNEVKEFDHIPSIVTNNDETDKSQNASSTLPEDSINLFDIQQLRYYENNRVVKDALDFIKKRRLNVAVNKPKALYISLRDYVHKNRLCIPFYNSDGSIDYYQTRAIYRKDELQTAKYLSKPNSDKTVYGLDSISNDIDSLFIFEGPIDSMFIKNGIALAGLIVTTLQKKLLKKWWMFNRIWILDNQLDNVEVKNKYKDLIERGERVFIWPKKFKEYKDFNEVCVDHSKNQIPIKFIKKYSFCGCEALLKLNA